MKDFLFALAFGLLALVLVIVIAFAVTAPIKIIECNQNTATIGFPHRYDIPGGCMIEVEPGRWIPLSNWRMVEPGGGE